MVAADRLEKLEARIDALESELAVHRLVARYGFSVDTGAADETASMFTDDCEFDIDGHIMRGPSDVRAMVDGPANQALMPNLAHGIGPMAVVVDGDTAVATGYSRIYHRVDDEIRLLRLGANQWELVRIDGDWRIRRRTVRMVGTDEGQRLLRSGLLSST
jgi:ketosteroid isomerase-like protein